MVSIVNYDKIMSDRKIFNEIVYTPLSEAVKLLKERRKDKKLVAQIDNILKGDIPEIFKNNKCGILCRQIATPNFDSLSFLSINKDNKLKPVFFEYINDKFVPDNEFKHSLGQLKIHKGINKVGDFIEEKITILDFNKYNGKKISEVKTFYGDTLESFHKKLFEVYKINTKKISFIDGSSWVKNNGNKASIYYVNLFLFFVCYGILFENFFISKDSEGKFTKDVLLPTLTKIKKITGLKPLIVPISPIEIERDPHALSYDSKIKKIINKK